MREGFELWDFKDDKDYYSLAVHYLANYYGYVAHILYNRRNAKQVQEQNQLPTCHSRRWIVERTHSWLNRFRRLLIRWKRKNKTAYLCST